MKRTVPIILAICLVISLSGCGLTAKPDVVVRTLCDALKTYNSETISSCFVDGKSTLDDPSTQVSKDEGNISSTQLLEFMKNSAAKMTYTIGESTINGESAIVPVTFNYVDASPVVTSALGEYISQALGLAFSGASEDEMSKLFETIFVEKAKTVSTGMATASISFDCTKTDSGWKLTTLSKTNESELDKVMTCNISSAFESLSNSDASDDNSDENITWHDIPINVEVKLATLKIKVTGSEEKSQLTTQYVDPDTAKAGTKFVVISVDLENITKDTINFDGDLKLTDDQGRSYEPYDNAYMYYNELINYTDLAPSIKQSGYMVYNIPTDSQNYFLSVAKSGSDDGYRLFMK
jgi:hypothetical protein